MSEIPYDVNQIIKSQARDGTILTKKQVVFSFHYSRTGNGMKSIRDAGYTHSTPGSQSSASYRLLSSPKIIDLIRKFRDGEFDQFKQEEGLQEG